LRPSWPHLPTVKNIGLIVAADTALVVQALFEERMLVQDDRHRANSERSPGP
jgi:hypothetical protein